MAVGIVLGAALLLGLGFVLQQHAAQQAPPEDALSYRLFLDLIGKPGWLAGVGAMIGGQVLGAVALNLVNVTLVEPLLTTNLLFALGLARLVWGQRLGRWEWFGAVLLSVGVAVFIFAAQPRGGRGPVSELYQWLFVGVVAGIATVLVTVARRCRATVNAAMLAAAAGLLYGLQDGFTRQLMLVLGGGGLARVLETWLPYGVFAVAIIGLLLAQSAFEAAPLQASLPAMTVAEPVTGIALGAGVFGDVVRLAPTWLALEAAGMIAMLSGVVLLTRSPMLTGSGSGSRVPQ